jgi:hypothetical protein
MHEVLYQPTLCDIRCSEKTIRRGFDKSDRYTSQCFAMVVPLGRALLAGFPIASVAKICFVRFEKSDYAT